MNLKVLIFNCLLLIGLVSLAQSKEEIAIKVSRVIVKIPEGKPIIKTRSGKKNGNAAASVYYLKAFRSANSFYPEEIKTDIERKLTQEGFHVEGWGSLFSELDDSKEPTLAIGLIVKDFVIYRNSLFTNVQISSNINWQVLDLENNEIVFNKDIQSIYDCSDIVIETAMGGYQYYNYSKEIRLSNSYFTDSLLNDSDFIEILKRKKATKVEQVDTNLISLRKFSLANSSNFLEKSMSGTVTIKSSLGFGSGFFINNSGLILTCYHNIKKSSNVSVYLNQGVSVSAKVIKVSPEYDLALIQIQDITSTPLTLYNDSNISIGNEVYAIGTPANKQLNQSVSKGILSGKRIIEGNEYLQTDASVSPGNSGGPLINNKGEVVGIVNAKVVAFGSEGIGFAIPLSVALKQLNIEIK